MIKAQRPPGVSHRGAYLLEHLRDPETYRDGDGWVFCFIPNIGRVTLQELVDAGYIEKNPHSSLWYRLVEDGACDTYDACDAALDAYDAAFGDLWVE